MTIDVIRKYLIYTWFPINWNVTPLFNDYAFDCDYKGILAFSDYSLLNDNSDYLQCIK